MNIPELFKSKRFWSAVIGLVVLIASSLNTQLADHLNVIAPTVIAIVGILIGGYSAEDVATAFNPPTTPATNVTVNMPPISAPSVDAAKSLTNAVVDAINRAP